MKTTTTTAGRIFEVYTTINGQFRTTFAATVTAARQLVLEHVAQYGQAAQLPTAHQLRQALAASENGTFELTVYNQPEQLLARISDVTGTASYGADTAAGAKALRAAARAEAAAYTARLLGGQEPVYTALRPIDAAAQAAEVAAVVAAGGVEYTPGQHVSTAQMGYGASLNGQHVATIVARSYTHARGLAKRAGLSYDTLEDTVLLSAQPVGVTLAEPTVAAAVDAFGDELTADQVQARAERAAQDATRAAEIRAEQQASRTAAATYLSEQLGSYARAFAPFTCKMFDLEGVENDLAGKLASLADQDATPQAQHDSIKRAAALLGGLKYVALAILDEQHPEPVLDDQPAVYIASLSDYNAGRLVGRWFELAQVEDAAELQQLIRLFLLSLGQQPGEGFREEWAAHDFQGFPRELYSEYSDHAAAIAYARILDQLSADQVEPFELWVANQAGGFSFDSETLENFQNEYRGKYEGRDDEHQIGEYFAELAEESGELKHVPEDIKYHIDWAGVARDRQCNGGIWAKNGHVFTN